MKIAKIILYDEPSVPEIELKKTAEFLKELFPVQVKIKDNFFHCTNKYIFEEIAETQIIDLKKPSSKHIPTSTEVLNEKENFVNQKEDDIILHEGFEIQKIITKNISIEKNDSNTLHIIFTEKAICTFDKDDFRYHARVWIGPNPVIISTTGIIEAPAKPKQYYLDLMTNFSQKDVSENKKKIQRRVFRIS